MRLTAPLPLPYAVEPTAREKAKTIRMGKHDREKEEDGQVPADKPIPKDDWIQKDNGGKHSGGSQDTDKPDDDER